MIAASPTGEQFELVWGGGGAHVRAVVTGLGAMLRVLEIDGVPIIEGFPEDGTPTFCAGQILIPWPNRVRDGRWSYGGRVRQLEITEPARGNALHGFLFALTHEQVSQSPSSVTLRATIAPQDAYPFSLIVDTTYTVGVFDGVPGVTVAHAIRNIGQSEAPTAIGAHPFFRIGDVPTGELTVTLGAASRVVVDDRLNPTGIAPVAGTPFDLSAGARVADLDLDTAYLDLTPLPPVEERREATRLETQPPNHAAVYVHTLSAPDGRRIELWGDENYKHAQVFTTPIFPTLDGLGTSITVEPTTAPPDAFNSGVDLRWVAPGETWESVWGVSFVVPDSSSANPTRTEV